MEEPRKTYLPAAGHDWFLPLYDPIVKLLGGDAARQALMDQAEFHPGQRVLDLGCGTGTLVVLVKSAHPDVEVLGLDPDPKALARAERKAEQAGISIQLDRGFSDVLPYSRASVDVVFSTFMFHHLQLGEKAGTLREVRRVLKPGGVFHLLDFAGAEAAEGGLLARLIHSGHHLQGNSEQQILALMREEGFGLAEKVREKTLPFGSLRANYFRGSPRSS